MLHGRLVNLKIVEQHEIPELYSIFEEVDISLNLLEDSTMITENNLGVFLSQTDSGTNFNAFTILSKEKEILGFLSLTNINRIRRSAYLKMVALKKSARCNGFALDACRVLAKYAFGTLNLNKLYAHTWSDNPKIKYLYQRGVGCTLEGTSRQHSYKNGKWVDMEVWGLLRHEYKHVCQDGILTFNGEECHG